MNKNKWSLHQSEGLGSTYSRGIDRDLQSKSNKHGENWSPNLNQAYNIWSSDQAWSDVLNHNSRQHRCSDHQPTWKAWSCINQWSNCCDWAVNFSTVVCNIQKWSNTSGIGEIFYTNLSYFSRWPVRCIYIIHRIALDRRKSNKGIGNLTSKLNPLPFSVAFICRTTRGMYFFSVWIQMCQTWHSSWQDVERKNEQNTSLQHSELHIKCACILFATTVMTMLLLQHILECLPIPK